MLARVSSVLFAFTLLALLAVVCTAQVEYFDAYEYMLSAMRLWGDSEYWYPKNATITAFYALLYAPYHWLGARPGLLVYQLPMLTVHLGLVLLTARWLRRFFPALPLLLIAGLAAWNRIFLHYAPFSHPDLFCAAWVVLWFYVDSELPLDSRRGKVARAVVLSGIALGRIHTVLIPAVAIIWNAARLRRAGPYLEAIAGSLALFAAGFTLFFGGFSEGLAFFRHYFTEVNTAQPGQPFHVYFGYLWSGLGPVGIALLLYGLYDYARFHRGSESLSALAGPLVGSLGYFLFLLVIGHKEARYLSQALPAWTALQCFGIAALARRRAAFGLAAAAALFASMAPELWRFTDPVYRVDIHRKAATRIAEWSRSDGVYFLRSVKAGYPMAAVYPKEHYFHWNDTAFYFFHWSAGAFAFHTGRPVAFTPVRATFNDFGYPLPDNIHQLAPAGVTLVLPASEIFTTMHAPEAIEPIHALRWWPRGQQPAGADCHSKVLDPCVELMTAFEGFSWSRHGD